MNKQEAKQMALVMAAFAEGLPIQFKPKHANVWNTLKPATAVACAFDFSMYSYRLPPPGPKVWYMPVYRMQSGSTRGTPVDEETYHRIKNEPAAYDRAFVKLVEAD